MVVVVIAYYDLTSCLILELGQPRWLEYILRHHAIVANLLGVHMTICSLGSGVEFGPHLDDALLALHKVLAAPWRPSKPRFLDCGRVPKINVHCNRVF